MIVGAESLAAAPAAEYDVCLVGAGPAAITVALELDRAGRRVCLLEAGGEAYQRRTQRLLEGETSGDLYPPLRDTRFAGLGGASQVWAGWCRPLDPRDFQGRDGACGWPFGREHLDPYYRRAHAYCGLGPYDYDPASWRCRLGRAPLAADGELMEHAVFQVSPVRFGTTWRDKLAGSSAIHLVLNAPVEGLRMAGNRVESLTVVNRDGRRLAVRARRYVLAAGGIENARLLLASGGSLDRAPGNGADLVGRYFTDHPFVNLGNLTLSGPPQALDLYFPQPLPQCAAERRGPAVRACLTLTPSTLASQGLNGAALFFHPCYESHPVFASREVRALLELWNKLHGKAVPGAMGRHLASAAGAPHKVVAAALRKLLVRQGAAARWRCRAMFETESRWGNRVTLSASRDDLGRPRARLAWSMSAADIASMQRVRRLFDAELRRSGIGRLEVDFPDTEKGWRARAEGGKHHMGTTRMHGSPRRGVVDANSRVHGVGNLYVAGSSVFPSGGYANPTLTIVALAIRLADHLGRGAP